MRERRSLRSVFSNTNEERGRARFRRDWQQKDGKGENYSAMGLIATERHSLVRLAQCRSCSEHRGYIYSGNVSEERGCHFSVFVISPFLFPDAVYTKPENVGAHHHDSTLGTVYTTASSKPRLQRPRLHPPCGLPRPPQRLTRHGAPVHPRLTSRVGGLPSCGQP